MEDLPATAAATMATDPPPARQAELEAAYNANRKRRAPPYAGVSIRATGELAWIMRQRGWPAEPDAAASARPDFREADLRNANLAGAQLQGANLIGARLDEAQLAAANLDGADLSDERAARNRSVVIALRAIAGMLILLSVIGQVAGSALIATDLPPVTLPLVGQVSWHDIGQKVVAVALVPFVLFLMNLAITAAIRALAGSASAGTAKASGSTNTAVSQAIASTTVDALRDVIRIPLIPFRRAGSAAARAGVNLRGASLRGANLRYRSLPGADLRDAYLEKASCNSAILTGADLTGAHLDGVNISGANLSRAHLDTVASLRTMNLDSQTNLGDVVWADVPRTIPDDARRREQRVDAQRDRSRVYRTVGLALRQQGLHSQAALYRLKEQRAERHALRLDGRYVRAFGSFLLDLVAGYGERPARIFVTYVVVVLGFAASYWGATNAVWLRASLHVQSNALQWYEALVLSLSSFHGRGFFPATISLGDPLAIIAALEAMMGLFVELMLIATFSRRFLGG